jgi:hypothetical protein
MMNLEISMKKIGFPQWIARFTLTLMILTPMLACNLIDSVLNRNNTDPIPLTLKELYSQTVSPSNSDQTISYQDKLNIILPSGVLSNSQTLTISEPTKKLPAPSKLRTLLGEYDISLGDQHQFDQNLLIEFSYDPKELDPKIPASEQLTAGYWDADNQVWVQVPSTVDETRNVISIPTDHLSMYGFFSWAAGYSASSSDHFLAIYNEKAISSGQAGAYTAVSPHVRTGIPPYISDTLEFLESAYLVYSDAGYDLPAGQIDVEIADFDTSELRSLVGNIRISTINFADPNDLRQDTAHELFHAVQRQTLGIVNYLSRHWWMEATADYAADHIAWASQGGTGGMGSDLKPKYLEITLTSTSEIGNHAYATSHFINWLVETKNVMSFKDLWKLTVAGGNDVLKTLIDSIQTPVPFGVLYTDYARFFIFDPASPDKKTTNISVDIANISSEFPEAALPLRQTFEVGYYTAKLWAVKNTFERDVFIERLDGGFGMVSYVVFDGDTRFDIMQEDFGTLRSGKPASVHLYEDDYLFILMDNTIDPAAQTFDIQISETAIPYGMFNMRLVFEGCDDKYNGGYNSYSRLNSQIPVDIGEKAVTIDYDKTTGDKHFVAEGSGKVDDKGILTLNYSMTFTRQLSCNGIPCEGTESGFGTFTGIWNSNLGMWEGKATGSVDVEYPNTLGNSGNNSISCSASIIKSKITPGFNDPDL